MNKGKGTLCEETVFDNDTSGANSLRSERMVFTNEAVPASYLQDFNNNIMRNRRINMDDRGTTWNKRGNLILAFALIRHLHNQGEISDHVYRNIKKEYQKNKNQLDSILKK